MKNSENPYHENSWKYKNNIKKNIFLFWILYISLGGQNTEVTQILNNIVI